MNLTLFVGSDHAGYAFKEELLRSLKGQFPTCSFIDLGCFDENSCDYPELAKRVGEEVGKGNGLGILICGSGIGVAIAANKVPGVRAATVWDVPSAALSKEHNNTNVLCLGARLVSMETALAAINAWLTTSFAGGRHQRRVDLISALEKQYGTSFKSGS